MFDGSISELRILRKQRRKSVAKYEEVGEYPFWGSRPEPPSNIHGGIILFPEYKEGSSIVYVSCRAYRDFPVTEFIEVVW
jgi:hypothetical protein